MAITKVELANMLLGVESTKKAAAKIKTSAIVGTAHNDSHDGYVLVDLGGDAISVDGQQYVSLATTSDVRAGDKVYVLLRGADGTAMGATVIGSAGGGDRTKGDIATAAADAATAQADASSAISMVNSVKAASDAHESQIDAIQKDIADYKDTAEATYATKTEVDSKTGAITTTLTADYTKTTDLGSTSAIKSVQAAAAGAKSTADAAKSTAQTAATDAAEAKAETKDLVTLRIDSSRGTVFKNSEVSTVLTVRCYKRGEEITTLTALRQSMLDATARIRWWVLRAGDADWVSLADSDEKLSEDGFALTLRPSDIDIKCTFKAEVVTD